MFATAPTSKLAQRTLGALRLTRSFLLLEDDYDVDWEVDRDAEQTQNHPHRVPLRGPWRRSQLAPDRRPGEVAATQQICLCPIQFAPDPQIAGTRRRQPCAQPRSQRARH